MLRTLALLLLCPALHAQSSTAGALSGTVSAETGEPLPNTTITLSHSSTAQHLTTASAADGRFHFPLLAPGSYSVSFAAPGFLPARLDSLAINLGESPSLDARLHPGSATEPEPCLCRLSSSALSTTVDEKTITAVPLTTRNITHVLSMASGSAADVNNAGSLGRGTGGVNVNGNTSTGGYSLDGAFSPSAVPNPDTIAEVKIQTTQYDAVYGAQAPSTALLTKSGENDLHGHAWEFVRNDIFNANSFFRNSTGQSKPNLKQNQFGGTLGGPILRNKLFFFGSFQGTRQVNGLDTTSTSNPILPPLTTDRSARTLAAAFCPANHPGDTRFLTFAGGRQLDCNNASTATTAPLHPVALKILQAKNPDGSLYVPVPQTLLANGLGFSSFALPSKYNENQYLFNADYRLHPHHALSARTYLTTIDQLRTFGSPGGYPGTAMLPNLGAPQALQAHDYVFSLGLSSTLSPHLTNEARWSFTRTTQDATGLDTPSASSFGLSPASRLFDQMPEINIIGNLGAFRLFGTTATDFTNDYRYLTFSDNLAFVHGAHRTRLGALFLHQSNDRNEIGPARGRLSFQTFPDFLLGLSAADNLSPAGRSNIQSIYAMEGTGPLGEVEYNYRTPYAAAYLQDDWKLRPNLSLYLGLRAEAIRPASEALGRIGNLNPALLAPIPPTNGTLAGYTVAANYDPNLLNPYTGKPFGPPPSGVATRPTRSFYENNAPALALAPRLAFAWQPLGANSRLNLRGGYGWFFQAPTFSANAPGAALFTAPPFAQGFTNTDASNNGAQLSQPFPTVTLGYPLRTATSQLSDRFAGPLFRLPRLDQWNLSTQWKLLAGFTLDASYVGSHGRRLLLARPTNQPLLASPSNPVNCGYDGVASHCITTSTAANAALRTPVLGETPTALQASEFSGSSSYHSLQTSLRRQAGKALTLQASYTWSRAANNTALFNDPANLRLSWARASFDRTHRLTTNFDYRLPALLRGSALRTALTDGWSLAGIFIVQAGTPMTLTDPTGASVFGRASTATVTLCPGATYATLPTSGSTQQRLNRYFNTSALCAPTAVGADGATGYGTAGPAILPGPGQFNTDFSLGKTTRVGGLREDALLAFRMELYNALNHPQFSNPGTTLRSATFGVITSNSVAPRLIQFALKYLF